MSAIKIDKLTKDFGGGQGLFDISLEIAEGETFGLVGANGAGKTTLIRHLMGFLKPQSGKCTIKDADCWENSEDIKKFVGYVPGEIAFPDAKNGLTFLKRQLALMGATDDTYMQYILDKLQLDATANLKRMSKGMKQKTALTAAFQHNPEILILDEPTTGLDPLMRASFVELLTEEKAKGKTILMSSHMFDEVEDTCDRVAMIKHGKILSSVRMDDIRHRAIKTYSIEFLDAEEFAEFAAKSFKILEASAENLLVKLEIPDTDINELTRTLKEYRLKLFAEIKYTVEDYFDEVYKEDK